MGKTLNIGVRWGGREEGTSLGAGLCQELGHGGTCKRKQGWVCSGKGECGCLLRDGGRTCAFGSSPVQPRVSCCLLGSSGGSHGRDAPV